MFDAIGTAFRKCWLLNDELEESGAISKKGLVKVVLAFLLIDPFKTYILRPMLTIYHHKIQIKNFEKQWVYKLISEDDNPTEMKNLMANVFLSYARKQAEDHSQILELPMYVLMSLLVFWRIYKIYTSYKPKIDDGYWLTSLDMYEIMLESGNTHRKKVRTLPKK